MRCGKSSCCTNLEWHSLGCPFPIHVAVVLSWFDFFFGPFEYIWAMSYWYSLYLIYMYIHMANRCICELLGLAYSWCPWLPFTYSFCCHVVLIWFPFWPSHIYIGDKLLISPLIIYIYMTSICICFLWDAWVKLWLVTLAAFILFLLLLCCLGLISFLALSYIYKWWYIDIPSDHIYIYGQHMYMLLWVAWIGLWLWPWLPLRYSCCCCVAPLWFHFWHYSI